MKDESNVQKIEYLNQISLSPTDPEVVKETLRRSLQIAVECGKSYYNVTYDLAMAKLALRIQSSEEEFSKLFILLDLFHIEPSFMKVIGKFITGLVWLTDSQILASGSVASFLSGKHFNRCRKIHPLLSLALQILHFKRFLDSDKFDLELIRNPLLQFNNQNTSSPRISDDTLLQLYAKFINDTLEGKHGKTDQIFFM